MKEIIIYGAGNMGKAVFELLKEHCRIKGFMDGNAALRGMSMMGVPIYHTSDVPTNQELCAADVLVAMTVCPFCDMRQMLADLGFSRIFPAGEYVAGFYKEYTLLNTWSHIEEFPKIGFSDGKSMEDYHAACEWFAHGIDEKMELTRDKYFPDFLSGQIANCKVMLDVAALDGGYIDAFLRRGEGRTAYAFCLTPQTVSVNALREKFERQAVHFLGGEAADQDGSMKYTRVGLMQPFTQKREYEVQTVKIDSAMKDIPFDYLRCYSMSEILPILKGGEESIKSCRPIISANIGHYESDFLDVPNYLKQLCSDYAFYFRMHSYQANDCILYAVPFEQQVRT